MTDLAIVLLIILALLLAEVVADGMCNAFNEDRSACRWILYPRMGE